MLVLFKSTCGMTLIGISSLYTATIIAVVVLRLRYRAINYSCLTTRLKIWTVATIPNAFTKIPSVKLFTVAFHYVIM